MRSQVIRVVVAVVLATTGTGVLVRYVEDARAEVVADESLVSVIVVQAKIDKGTPAGDIAAKVRTEQVPAKVRADDAVTNLDQVKALHAAVDLLPGEQLVKARFTGAGTAAASKATEGLLQVTVPLEPERALGGNIRAGDTVGVLLSIEPIDTQTGQKRPTVTHLALHKVPVTNVQVAEQTVTADQKKTDAPTAIKGKYLVTLAVTAPAAEQVVFTTQNGSIWLTAEPADASTDGTRPVTSANVLGGDAR